ncbi:MORN repeat protein [Arenibacter algicola]|jgi:antitoxin component YwqK of YwqJK toxin-antitoxin module|uniref:MORN repeat protein n=1 Tax=Arenibacter algicola TaxID=616991 RepID=A0A221UUJ9_9FLAO|nr:MULTISPECIES: nicotinic acid mononucleotide adenyltransferase [Arenibacter]ASO05059.1 MORN repeat variant [Arenibacter algicola]MDX1760498.1 nicotinic acid mononucleotide adenyltransferase [Arenibacter algicola]GBF18327.1 MORN repeat variant [Arenibacter sp. NBRC 103722]|tara:strand:- start:17491 stop:17841 length:351 start_codon:yes stop_codon:yes gene_type:complete
MKGITLIFALIFSVVINAQDIKPVFEQDGEMLKATYYHDNGVVSQEGQFLNGKLHGEWKMFAEDGKKIAMGEYTEGKKTGKWFFWDAKKLKEVDFVDSKIANVTEWNSMGQLAVNK